MSQNDCSGCLCNTCAVIEHCPVAPQHNDLIRPNPCVDCFKGMRYISAKDHCPDYVKEPPPMDKEFGEAIKAELAARIDGTILPYYKHLVGIQLYIRADTATITFDIPAEDILRRMAP